MQTVGTWLQLVGVVITLGGLVWAWRKLSRLPSQWGAAINRWATQLRNAIPSLNAPPPSTHQVSAHLAGHGQAAASMTLKRAGTTDERITQLENDHNDVLNALAQQESALRDETKQAIADALDNFQTLSDTVRLRDIGWAVGGIAVSIAGYLFQLFG